MIKMDEEIRGCLSKTEEGEPVFVLCARDKMAPAIVRVWASIGKLMGVSQRKLEGAHRVAWDMEEWQKNHPDKVKIPD